MAFNGCLDRCDRELVAGWAMYPCSPERRAVIDVYTGGRFLGQCVADQYRRDLDEAGLLGGCCSFNFEPPSGLSAAEIGAIRAVVRDSGYMFACGVPQPMLDVEIDRIYPVDATEGHERPRRFSHCILHIGCEKTGSSTLQTFLHRNRDALARGGYFVPLSLAPDPGDGGINHCYLPTLAMDDHGFGDDLRAAAAITDAAALLAYRRQIFAALRDEIRHAPPAADTLILSSEHCHSRLSSVQSIRHLKAFLDRFCDHFKILVYLRPQHDVAVSRYGMFVLSGLSNIEMFPPLRPPPGYDRVVNTPAGYFDYADLLGRWARVFGEAAVQPRLFAQSATKDGGLVSDFIADLDVPPGLLIAPPAQNNNVSAAAQDYVLRLLAGGAVPAGIMAAFAALLRARHPGCGMPPLRHEASAFFGQFAAGNEAVRQRWFPERQTLFACDFSAYPGERMPPSRQDDAMFDALLREAGMGDAGAPAAPAPPTGRTVTRRSSRLRDIMRRRPALPATP